MAKKMGAPKGSRNATKVLPDRVADVVEEMIDEYMESGILPTDFRLQEKVKVSQRTIDRWYSGELDREDDEVSYKDSLQRLISFRSQLCIENLANGASNKATNWIFLAKQPRWGGFQDSVQRTETKGSQDIKITIAGADGKPLRKDK